MGANDRGRRIIPGHHYGGVEIVEVGPPDYRMPMPGIPGVGTPSPPPQPVPRSRTPLVPSADEIAKLPRLARIAFAERCALRVKPVCALPNVTVGDAARVIFETATTGAPLTAQLRCIRRDFARLKRLAREQKWTDDTPVPPDVFGPMWPPGVAPYWATESVPTPPQV